MGTRPESRKKCVWNEVGVEYHHPASITQRSAIDSSPVCATHPRNRSYNFGKSVGDIVRTFAHEYRSPLTSVSRRLLSPTSCSAAFCRREINSTRDITGYTAAAVYVSFSSRRMFATAVALRTSFRYPRSSSCRLELHSTQCARCLSCG